MTETTARTHQMIFVNLPVADVARTRKFFTALGYRIDEHMSDDNCLGVELGPNHYAMLLRRDFFASFHDQELADPGQREVLVCLSADSVDAVDELVDKATAAGGRQVRPPSEEGAEYMYSRAFADPDGHVWEIMWMDVAKATAAGAFG